MHACIRVPFYDTNHRKTSTALLRVGPACIALQLLQARPEVCFQQEAHTVPLIAQHLPHLVSDTQGDERQAQAPIAFVPWHVCVSVCVIVHAWHKLGMGAA